MSYSPACTPNLPFDSFVAQPPWLSNIVGDNVFFEKET